MSDTQNATGTNPVAEEQSEPSAVKTKGDRASTVMQITIALMCAALVALWAIMGFLSGVKPPFTFLVFRFEGGYQPEPGFMSTLTTLVTGIISGALGLAGVAGAKSYQAIKDNSKK